MANIVNHTGWLDVLKTGSNSIPISMLRRQPIVNFPLGAVVTAVGGEGIGVVVGHGQGYDDDRLLLVLRAWPELNARSGDVVAPGYAVGLGVEGAKLTADVFLAESIFKNLEKPTDNCGASVIITKAPLLAGVWRRDSPAERRWLAWTFDGKPSHLPHEPPTTQNWSLRIELEDYRVDLPIKPAPSQPVAGAASVSPLRI